MYETGDLKSFLNVISSSKPRDWMMQVIEFEHTQGSAANVRNIAGSRKD